MKTRTPKCIGIILDGNRRWAKERGLSTLEGHRVGLVETLRNTTRLVRDKGIKNLVVFMFSTENWQRDPKEVSYLMDLFRESVKNEIDKLIKEGIRVRFAGQRERFSVDLQEAMSNAEEKTLNNSAITLWMCLSYGGRAEIVSAAKAAATGGEITDKTLTNNLWTVGMPDPDIIIRTGGEKRLSGFLTWQSIYSELFFVKEYWPDFDEAILDSILSEFAERERRMGE